MKAAREAKVHTAWLEPDLDHESALTEFAAGLVSDREFIEELEAFAGPLWRAGALDSLAQTVLRLCSPGVPDVYRGSELWDLSLTDPDNRRPVDWALRERLLEELDDRSGEEGLFHALGDTWEDGRIKLAVTAAALRARRSRPELFGEGAYLPLEVQGERNEHVIAFARNHGEKWALAVAPRLTLQLAGDGLWAADGWDGTEVALPADAPQEWHDHLTGEERQWNGSVPLTQVFGVAPVGIFTTHTSDDRNEQ